MTGENQSLRLFLLAPFLLVLLAAPGRADEVVITFQSGPFGEFYPTYSE